MTVADDGTVYINGVPIPDPGMSIEEFAQLVDETFGARGYELTSWDSAGNGYNTVSAMYDACWSADDCRDAAGAAFRSLYLADSLTLEMILSGGRVAGMGSITWMKIKPRYTKGGSTNGCRNSFSGETEVLMADGTTKPISEVQIGDRVLATDPETGEQSEQLVTMVWIHEDTLADLELEYGTILTTTEDHPFWNETDQKWQRADALDSGDQLLSSSGETLTVSGFISDSERVDLAYNLTVEETHTYFVSTGEAPILVHNDGGWTIDPKKSTAVMRGVRSGRHTTGKRQTGTARSTGGAGTTQDTARRGKSIKRRLKDLNGAPMPMRTAIS